MDTLYTWQAKRAGAAITITHSTGKITGVAEIAVDDQGRVRAHVPGKEMFDLQLSTAPHQDATTDSVSNGVSDLFFNNEQACEAYRDAADPTEPSLTMTEAAEGFQTMLRGAGIVPPTVDALWRDFLDRV